MNVKVFLYLMGIWTLCCTGVQAQSGWSRVRQSWYAKLDASVFRSSTYYNPDGEKVNSAEFRQNAINLYGEYGCTDRLTAIISWPLLRTNAFERTETVYGTGDLRLEAKYRFTGNAWPVSISIAPEIPTGRANAMAENMDFPGNFINLPTGDGEFNVWATLAASKSLGQTYVSAFTAYDFRTAYEGMAFQDLYQFGAEFGWNPVKPVWIIGKARAQYSTGDSEHAELGFLRGDASEFTQYTLEASWQVTPRWGASFCFSNMDDFVAPLQNVYAAPTYTLGVFYKTD